MQKSQMSRLLSIALILALLFQMLPLPVFAASEGGNDAAGITESTEPVTIIGEEESLRTETGKHFRLSDGSYIAVSYGQPVHYQDEAGALQDIINEPIMVTGVDDIDTYQISNDGQTTSFASSLVAGTIFTSSYEDVSVSMSLMDTVQALELEEAQTASAISETSQPVVTEEDCLTYSRSATAALTAADASVLNIPKRTACCNLRKDRKYTWNHKISSY